MPNFKIGKLVSNVASISSSQVGSGSGINTLKHRYVRSKGGESKPKSRMGSRYKDESGSYNVANPNQ